MITNNSKDIIEAEYDCEWDEYDYENDEDMGDIEIENNFYEAKSMRKDDPVRAIQLFE